MAAVLLLYLSVASVFALLAHAAMKLKQSLVCQYLWVRPRFPRYGGWGWWGSCRTHHATWLNMQNV